jgi:hypothetical protein
VDLEEFARGGEKKWMESCDKADECVREEGVGGAAAGQMAEGTAGR